ncbi:MAG: M3 family metallopeptidase [Gammaproteobacteria bacterium]|nr:M3 family metallopeptidase [Gammaproteobacteria bacterium]
MANPFFEPLPENGVPEFEKILSHHYEEAFERGFEEQNREIQAIIGNREAPTFGNTIEAMERSGELLERVGNVFWNLTSSDTSDELQALELALSPRLAAHNSQIYSDPALFKRVQAITESDQALDPEASQLLEEIHGSFVRAGAHLSESARERVNEITESLAGLTTRFGQNVLQDVNEFELVVDAAEDISGLPDSVLNAARSEAESRGKPGQYVFTISRSSITPFLQYADSRSLREKLYRAYTDCGTMTTDNHPVIQEIIEHRAERAKILGFGSHADFMLDDRMAKTPEAVKGLLDRVWTPCQDKVAKEAQDLQSRIQEDGGNFELQPWDWWYYTEKIRQERFDLDEEAVKPYFKLENVRDGAFEVAHKLYGIKFEQVDVPVYHPDVVAYEVTDADGSTIGIFLFDFFMRASKQGGAWMSEFRGQSNLDEPVRPVIVNCCNFPKADPCLLGMDEVRTLFHEFGHGLHGLLSKVRYPRLSGTNVKQDFVELPSQIMEHWALEPEVLKSYAIHHETGEPIPDELIKKLKSAQTFNQGFATTEYLAACYLDLAWHQQEGHAPQDVDGFERKAMDDIHKIKMVDPRYRSAYFRHIFEGEHYSAGYYVYIWAEVLDADGFEAFREKGIFDQETARSFRSNILEKGASVPPMELYRKFRGREPDVAPLLKNRGLL